MINRMISVKLLHDFDCRSHDFRKGCFMRNSATAVRRDVRDELRGGEKCTII